MSPGQRNGGGEQQIGVELRAYAPARPIPRSEVEQVQTVHQQEIGEDGIGRPARGLKRRRRAEPARRMRQAQEDERDQDGEVQRVYPPEAQQCKTPSAESLGKALLVICRDDEPAQHEKEVDEEVTVRNQSQLVQVAVQG